MLAARLVAVLPPLLHPVVRLRRQRRPTLQPLQQQPSARKVERVSRMGMVRRMGRVRQVDSSRR